MTDRQFSVLYHLLYAMFLAITAITAATVNQHNHAVGLLTDANKEQSIAQNLFRS